MTTSLRVALAPSAGVEPTETPAAFVAEQQEKYDQGSEATTETGSTVQAICSGQNGRACVMYGIGTCGRPAQEALMQTLLGTWAKDIPRRYLVIVGGSHDDYNEGIETVPSTCPDHADGFGCKEATILYRAAKRARTLNADWVYILQEDKYIRYVRLEQALGLIVSDKPLTVATMGCGRAWANNPASKNGTVPAGKGWVEPPFMCEAVWKYGSICGGSGYAVNTLGLEQLVGDAKDASDFADMMLKGQGYSAPGASDLVTSCMMYRRGITFSSVGLPTGVELVGDGTEQELLKLVNERLSRWWELSYHIAVDRKAATHILREMDRLDEHKNIKNPDYLRPPS